MTKPTGRPPGRPRKNPDEPTPAKRINGLKRSAHIVEMGEIFGLLTPIDIEKLLPRDIFRMLVKVAIMAKDDQMLHALARDWGPYEHARKSDGPQLTPEEVRRLGEIARSEAARRGIVIPTFDRIADGAVPN